MSFVLKITYGLSTRRLTVAKDETGAPALSFNELIAKIREYFGIPQDSRFALTYVDKEGDTITMGEAQELHDACVLQGLNPLRINVVVEAPQASRDLQPLIESTLNALHIKNDGPLKSFLEPLLKDGSQKAFSEFSQYFSKTEQPDAVPKAEPKKEAPSPPAEVPQPRKEATPVTDKGKASESSQGVNSVVHLNVQCDGCGVTPLPGPRFKSASKEDYDLCMRCYSQLSPASAMDYLRYDRPIQRRCVHRFPSFPHFAYRAPRISQPKPCRLDSVSSWSSSKPDGRFVCDVTIPDGQELEPNTPFVKIWRLRNNGRVPWTHGIQLVRVGGDELGPVSAVTLQLPEGGVLPEAEVEVAVDFVAPEKPGRYVSYWRLMTPGHVKFGHRVWALIHVSANSEAESSAPVVRGGEAPEGRAKQAEVVEVKAEGDDEEPVLVEANGYVDGPTGTVEVPVSASVAPAGAVKVDVQLGELNNALEKAVEEEETVKDEEEIDKVEEEEAKVAKAEEDKAAEEDEERGEEDEGFSVVDEDVSEDILMKLESMGWKNRELCLELLEKNAYDVQRTVDDLLHVEQWSPVLVELEEMGFTDGDLNRRLMFKNKGSMKHVVKELVQMASKK